jgi:hypothetical protein
MLGNRYEREYLGIAHPRGASQDSLRSDQEFEIIVTDSIGALRVSNWRSQSLIWFQLGTVRAPKISPTWPTLALASVVGGSNAEFRHRTHRPWTWWRRSSLRSRDLMNYPVEFRDVD